MRHVVSVNGNYRGKKIRFFSHLCQTQLPRQPIIGLTRRGLFQGWATSHGPVTDSRPVNFGSEGIS